MIDDMALLKQAMDQMDAEDPTVAQAAKDRAAQILSDAKLSFSKMAELIQQRRLLLQPAIVARIKRMDQPGMLGDAAFRDTGSALRKEGQSFLQIAEAIEGTGKLAPGDRVQTSEPPHLIASEPFYQMASEPGSPAWLTALALVVDIVLFPLRHPLRFLAIALFAILLFYGFRAVATLSQQVSGYFSGARQMADTASSRPSSEAAPPTPPAPIPSPSAAAPSAAAPSPSAPSPSATPSPAPPATAAAPPAPAPVPPANEPVAPAAPAAAPAVPPATVAGPPASTSRREAQGAPPSKSAANCCTAREDHPARSRCCAPFEDDRRPRAFEDDRRPRALEDIVPEAIRRNSRIAGPCIGGVGGCYWGGGQH